MANAKVTDIVWHQCKRRPFKQKPNQTQTVSTDTNQTSTIQTDTNAKCKWCKLTPLAGEIWLSETLFLATNFFFNISIGAYTFFRHYILNKNVSLRFVMRFFIVTSPEVIFSILLLIEVPVMIYACNLFSCHTFIWFVSYQSRKYILKVELNNVNINFREISNIYLGCNV
jgi:hypothetical protein